MTSSSHSGRREPGLELRGSAPAKQAIGLAILEGVPKRADGRKHCECLAGPGGERRIGGEITKDGIEGQIGRHLKAPMKSAEPTP